MLLMNVKITKTSLFLTFSSIDFNTSQMKMFISSRNKIKTDGTFQLWERFVIKGNIFSGRPLGQAANI